MRGFELTTCRTSVHYSTDVTNRDIPIDNVYVHKNDNMSAPSMHATMHINIHSLPSKYEQLQQIIRRRSNIKLDYILLCETFVNDNNEVLYNIEEYVLITGKQEIETRILKAA